MKTYVFAFCPRVGSVVGAGQVGEIKVGIDLRRGDVGVSEQLLHSAQILTRFKQMRGEGMPEQVRMDMARKAFAPRPVSDAELDGAVLEARAIPADEQRRFTRCRRVAGAFAQPYAQRRRSLAAHRHDARLASLAEHPHGAVGEIELSDVETDELIEPQPGRIEQLHDRLVAHRQRVVGRDVEQLVELIDVERAGQASRRLGRADVHGRIAGDRRVRAPGS